jgi:hypothetical protein
MGRISSILREEGLLSKSARAFPADVDSKTLSLLFHQMVGMENERADMDAFFAPSEMYGGLSQRHQREIAQLAARQGVSAERLEELMDHPEVVRLFDRWWSRLPEEKKHPSLRR